jgi:hypothetical protein
VDWQTAAAWLALAHGILWHQVLSRIGTDELGHEPTAFQLLLADLGLLLALVAGGYLVWSHWHRKRRPGYPRREGQGLRHVNQRI